ncbi:MAG: endonuclease MutS2 [Firmicutes bacterium HGW-Firmicutes-9]|jgi:DNA mismatch repair protein MutS2|nr:MAG: endonuclease MutS2 [Firmicutes bacterium HGW-Firmicutes-9]
MIQEKTYTTLEYDKILSILKQHLASEVGLEYAEKFRPVTLLKEAETLQEQTWEAESIYTRTGRTPISGFPDVRELVGRMHASLFLSTRELLSIASAMRAAREAKEILQSGDENSLLCNLANRLTSHRSVEEEVARCILGEDEISDNASPELNRIRRQIKIVGERVREKLNNMLKSQTTQKYLQETVITIRNGRYVLPVKAEHRSQVPGLVHDQSSSGATLFIEPSAVVELGNETKRLFIEEKNEIERILSGLTAMIAPFADEIHISCNVMGALDVIFARAIMARDQRAVRPKLNEEGRVRIVRGRHPLIAKDRVVPVDIWLGETFRTLIITGPNTGGKTVTLKTVGLFSLMAMSGMFIPAQEGTELSTFDNVFADIGDEQSIEQSLSTFSSHMTNTVRILAEADERSLVLLDELGAGTDPVEGAALAQAILESLYERSTLTVATTHYSEIKAFALMHAGMQNASMEFDVDRLCPTYRLFIGIPGKSNAFEISRRLGLSDAVISRAQDFLQKKDIAFETVLSEAEQARRSAENDKEAIYKTRIETEKIKTELEKEKKKLEDEKTLLRQKAREDARRMVQETRQDMEKLIAGLRSIENIDHKQLERAVQSSRDAMRKTEERLYEQAVQRDTAGEAPTVVHPGQRVKLITLGQEATVLKPADAKGEVLVQAGIMKLSIPLNDIRPVEQQKKKPQPTAAKVTLSQDRGNALSIDLRGSMVDDACMELDRFIDNALITGIYEFYVVHGKGTGALRTGVQQYLKNHPRVKSYRIGAYGEGDAGVTVVTLKS